MLVSECQASMLHGVQEVKRKAEDEAAKLKAKQEQAEKQERLRQEEEAAAEVPACWEDGCEEEERELREAMEEDNMATRKRQLEAANMEAALLSQQPRGGSPLEMHKPAGLELGQCSPPPTSCTEDSAPTAPHRGNGHQQGKLSV